MTNSFTCPTCKGIISLPTVKLKFIFNNIQNNPRAYGDERIHSGTITGVCPHCLNNLLLNIQLHEYPAGIARYQKIEQSGILVSDTTDISMYAPLNPKTSNAFLYGTLFSNRNTSDFFIVDRMSDQYAAHILNKALTKLKIPSLSGFPNAAVFKRKLFLVNNSELLPPAVCSCMSLRTRTFSYGIAGNINTRFRKILNVQLKNLGYIYGKSSSSRKSNCTYPLGNCAEIHAANNLLKKKGNNGLQLGSILFGVAIRPRTMQIILPCENCSTVFPSL